LPDEGAAIASESTRVAIQRELQDCSDGGAGLVELLGHLHTFNRDLGRRDRLSDDQLDELSLYCWTLQRESATDQLWGRARELWGSTRITSRGRPALRRRARALDQG
jgi:hypothetical protein